MRLLKDSYLYGYYDKSAHLTDTIRGYEPNRDNLDLKYLEENLHVINKFNFPLKMKTMLDVKSGLVVPAYNPDMLNLPSALPVFLYKNSITKNIECIVNLGKYGKKKISRNTNQEYLDIENKKLFALLQTGSVTLGIFHNWNKIIMNQNVCKKGAILYSKIILKIMDKLFAVNLNDVKSDKVKYMAAKFFLSNMLGKPINENLNSIAYTCCSNGTPKSQILRFDSEVNPNIYQDFNTFIEGMAQYIDGCSTLTTRGFVDDVIKSYGPSFILALDYFPYFCHNIFAVIVGCMINHEYILDKLIGNDADKFYNELSGIIKG